MYLNQKLVSDLLANFILSLLYLWRIGQGFYHKGRYVKQV